ncbi:MAG: cytochrome P450 [Labedaea sp.]
MVISMAPGRLPLVGHAVQVLRSPLDFFMSLREQGEVVLVRLGPMPAYVVTEPDLVRRILVQDAKKFERGVQFDKARAFLGDGLFTEPEPDHLRHRRMMQPAFHHERLTRYVDLMCRTAEQQVRRWPDAGRIDVGHEMLTFTVDSLCRSLLSAAVPAANVAHELARSLPVLLDGLALRVAVPIKVLSRIPTPGNRRFELAKRRLWAVLDDVITSYRHDGTDRQDLMSMLLAARDEASGTGLDDRQLRDHAMAFFLGGVETSAYTLSWVCHLLSRHPELQDRLAGEVGQVLAGHALSSDDLAKFGGLRRVITEVLRLYPPVWLLSRRATENLRLGSHEIPAGSQVLFSIYAIHRDAQVYDQPDTFDPDRWLPPRGQATPRGSFLPFGAGNRGCIGESFAWTELLVFLAVVLRSWRLHPGSTDAVRPIVGAALKPSPATILIRPRQA